MPYLIGLPMHVYGMRDSPALGVEQTQFDFFRVLGKHRKINAFTVPRGTKGIGFTWPNCWSTFCHGLIESVILPVEPKMINHEATKSTKENKKQTYLTLRVLRGFVVINFLPIRASIKIPA
jgi:hypothetical protein